MLPSISGIEVVQMDWQILTGNDQPTTTIVSTRIVTSLCGRPVLQHALQFWERPYWQSRQHKIILKHRKHSYVQRKIEALGNPLVSLCNLDTGRSSILSDLWEDCATWVITVFEVARVLMSSFEADNNQGVATCGNNQSCKKKCDESNSSSSKMLPFESESSCKMRSCAKGKENAQLLTCEVRKCMSSISFSWALLCA